MAMIIGVPKEIKIGEERVALTPAGGRGFGEAGHRVLVEAGAGAGSGFRDEDYTRAGAVVTVVEDVWSQAELILKVRSPCPRRSRGSATARFSSPICIWRRCPN